MRLSRRASQAWPPSLGSSQIIQIFLSILRCQVSFLKTHHEGIDQPAPEQGYRNEPEDFRHHDRAQDHQGISDIDGIPDQRVWPGGGNGPFDFQAVAKMLLSPHPQCPPHDEEKHAKRPDNEVVFTFANETKHRKNDRQRCGEAEEPKRLPASRAHRLREVQQAVIEDLKNNGQAAVSFARPTDDRAVQVKGEFISMRDADASEEPFVMGQWGGLLRELDVIGLAALTSTSSWLMWPCVAVTLRVTAVFSQTPGPEAGAVLA